LLASSDKIKVQRKQITTLSLMNEANNNAAAVCSAQTVNAPLREARKGSAQSAMTQAKKKTLQQSMEQATKQSVRELARGCHNAAQDQHSKASSACCVFTRPNRE
jgi:hypothetical protein